MRLVEIILLFICKIAPLGDKKKMGLQLLQRMVTLAPMEFPGPRVTSFSPLSSHLSHVLYPQLTLQVDLTAPNLELAYGCLFHLGALGEPSPTLQPW
jgi:hypothetical protein